MKVAGTTIAVFELDQNLTYVPYFTVWNGNLILI